MDINKGTLTYDLKRASTGSAGNHPNVEVQGLFEADQGTISAGCLLTRETVGNLYVPWATTGSASDIVGVNDYTIDTSAVSQGGVVKHGGVFEYMLHVGTGGGTVTDAVKIALADKNIIPMGVE